MAVTSISEGHDKSCKGWKRLEPDRIEASAVLQLESEKARGAGIPGVPPESGR
jgi:hypothetical protein